MSEALPPLGKRIVPTDDSDEILSRFLDWTSEAGYELFPAQEEAILELLAGRHVILETPTGSGKSLVALALHFASFCRGTTSWYTAPIKALASEKFFALCDLFGAERVGMSTGDASINPEAGLVCCTAEVLSNLSIRKGDDLGAADVVMDEFHYYGDSDRGVAWQVPLLTLPKSRFLLMSATLGDVTSIRERLEKRTRRAVAHVSSEHRPVPLDWEWRETPISETVAELLADRKSPIYVVSFSQRGASELAQALTSLAPADRAARERIGDRTSKVRFDTPYGKELRRLLRFGVGVHHAGLLPKYRLLVEQLAQEGLLPIVCGTDTLGVGINVPIRTVVFTSLAKYDGQKTRILSVRDFKQIAGRAGRKGFDAAGSVVSQAPEWEIERKKNERKAADGKKVRKSSGPPEGAVGWSVETFSSLIRRPPETLRSRFRVTPEMILLSLQRDEELDIPEERNFASLRAIFAECHEDEARRAHLVREAAARIRSLRRAGILRMVPDRWRVRRRVVLDPDLQIEFSLHRTLSLFLFEAVRRLDLAEPGSELRALSFAEAILEDPMAILLRQLDRAKGEAIQRMKEEGLDYDQRMAKLDEVTWPKPEADFLGGAFEAFRKLHPWVGVDEIRPKSIGREMVEGYFGFSDYVRHHGLQRSEGLLLRYLSQLWKTLAQSIPENAKTDPLVDLEAYFRTLIERTDTSLLEEWESLTGRPREDVERRHERHLSIELSELLEDRRAFTARVRTELHLVVKALSAKDWEEAGTLLRAAPDDPLGEWTPERIEKALAPFFAEHERLLFDPHARLADKTQLRATSPLHWDAVQILCDPAGDDLWALSGEIDLSSGKLPDGPLVAIRRIGP